jgi:hypothetical protein
MQNALKQRLDKLREVHGWDEILIKHEQDGGETIGIHNIFAITEDNEGNEVPSILGWSVAPILAADNLSSLKQLLEHLLDLVNEKLVTTEEEIAQYNCS